MRQNMDSRFILNVQAGLTNLQNKETMNVFLPWRFSYHEDLEKREGVWFGGARETQESRVTIEWLLPKENIFLNLAAFQNLKSIKKGCYNKRIRLFGLKNFLW